MLRSDEELQILMEDVETEVTKEQINKIVEDTRS